MPCSASGAPRSMTARPIQHPRSAGALPATISVARGTEHKVLVGELEKTAIHYVFKAHPGPWLEVFAKLLGRMPEDSHAWTITDEGVPAFAKFEGPLNPAGPVWRIELTSPRWPD